MAAFFSAFSSSKLEKYPKKRGWSEKLNTFPYIRIQVKEEDGYLIPDFKWEEFQMVKHRSSIRLCWRRYCKRAAKQNLMAYSWKVFLTSYNDYRRPKIQVDDPDDKIRTKLKHYNFLLAYCESDKVMYSVIQTEKVMWLKSLGLEENKIIGDRKK